MNEAGRGGADLHGERRRAHRQVVAMPFLRAGFRPFFLLGSAWAVIAIVLWLGMLAGFLDALGDMDPVAWHQHEMLFGFTSAVVAGFILTAIPNWTGRLPVAGRALAALASLWLLGRVALLLGGLIGAPLAALIDTAFLFLLAGLIAREIIKGSNWRNLPPALLITLLAIANVLFHLEHLDVIALDGFGTRIGIAALAMLIGLIGGRIVPSFTRNWLAKRQAARLPSPFVTLDKIALLLLAIALTAWIAAPESLASGVLLAAAGIMHAVRLSRWCGWHCLAEPLVFILHLGYAWLAIGVSLLGLANLVPAFSNLAALHALTAGAFGTMMLAVMTRATLGHTGRALTADRKTVLIFAAVTVGAIARVLSPLFADQTWLLAAGLLWASAFLMFVLVYGPMLLGFKPLPAEH
ncbi:MAG: NnrS family protein [Geminicoccaceae bacterium]